MAEGRDTISELKEYFDNKISSLKKNLKRKDTPSKKEKTHEH